jgi:Uma2 family endonuclease
MGMAAPIYHTADMVRALPQDGKRYETVYGELLVTPAPRLAHQYVVLQLVARLQEYLRLHPAGQLLIAPADISWTPDVLVQPDVFVVPTAEARTFDWKQIKTLLLAIEVTSPSTVRADRFTKRRLYQEVGVPAYWVVDIDGRLVETWTPAASFPNVERERVTWLPQGVPEPLVIPVPEILPPS